MTNEHKEAMEIDLQKLILVFLNRWWLILLCSVVAAIVSWCATVNFITPMYAAEVTVYVNNVGRDQKINYITGSNLETAKHLVNTYIEIIKSDSVLEKVSQVGDLGMKASQIRGCMHALQKGEAEIFVVRITHPDPQMAARIANAVAEVAPGEIESFVEGSSTKVIDYAKVPGAPFSPNLIKNIIKGGLIGGLLAVAYVAFMFFVDVRIKDEEELAVLFNLPVLGQIPGFASVKQKPKRSTKRTPYESENAHQTDAKEKRKRLAARKQDSKIVQEEQDNLLSEKSGFFIREAYKTLRTNVSFTLTGEEKSKIVVVTSSLQGEGKSITAVNLAISYAMADQKVLLIDCDMRRPKLSRLIKRSAKVGLSNLILDPKLLPEAICHTHVEGLDVILAGNIPPNPSELLGSMRMQRLLEELRESYDYIFLDSPPVNMVTDAVVLAPKSDGVLFLVRANQSERGSVICAVEQLEYAKAKILGFVLNDADIENKRYGSGKKYKSYLRYGKYGYYGNDYRGYGSNAPNINEITEQDQRGCERV